MDIIVCIKQTFDTEAKIVLNSNGKIDDNGVNLIINPYDEYAIEEGLKLKTQLGGVVTVVSLGAGARAQEAVRTALAMGADKGVLVSDPVLENTDEWGNAEILAKAISQIPYDVILLGRIAVDDGASQIAVRLAEVLDIPSVSSVVKVDATETQVTLKREIDGGTEIIEVNYPVLISAQKGLNVPRYPNMPGIIKAKKKELKVLTLADLGMNTGDLAPKMPVSGYSLPNARQAGKIIEGEAEVAAKELARLLREEAKAL